MVDVAKNMDVVCENQDIGLSYTVDALVEKLGVSANVQIWKSISSLIHVQGIVSKISKKYQNVVYFDLKGGSTIVSVKCPFELRPIEGDCIVVEGMPIFKPSRFSSGLDIVIEGKPVANVAPPKHDSNKEIIKLHKESYVRLHDYLSQKWVHNFYLLGTETAVRDVLSQIQTDVRELIQTRIIRVSEKTSMLSDLLKAIDKCDAFSIVRGGDDDSLELWNDPDVARTLLSVGIPFYVALGHTHFISLTTQYADENFNTPSDLGRAINIMTQSIVKERTFVTELDNVRQDKSILDKDIAVLREKERGFKEKLTRLTNDTKILYKQRNESKKLVKNLVRSVVALLSLIAFYIIW